MGLEDSDRVYVSRVGSAFGSTALFLLQRASVVVDLLGFGKVGSVKAEFDVIRILVLLVRIEVTVIHDA